MNIFKFTFEDGFNIKYFIISRENENEARKCFEENYPNVKLRGVSSYKAKKGFTIYGQDLYPQV